MKRILIILSSLAALTGCIKNDIPYPVIVPHITSMEVDGAKSVSLSMDGRMVSIALEEQTDPRKVNVVSFAVDEEMTKLSEPLVGVHDLTDPLTVTLSTYQDYDWTISATKDVERCFTVKGQIGSSHFDAVNRRVIAYVRNSVILSSVEVTSLKLGPADVTSYSMEMSQIRDFTSYVELDVTYFDTTETWKIYVEHSDASVNIKNINPWTREAYITADGVAGVANGFKYRKSGSQAWIDVAESDITSNGGEFTAHIHDLDPDTEYECYAFSGKEDTAVEVFMTDPATPLPNHSLDNVSLVTGYSYYKWFDPLAPNEDGRYMFWGTGNGEGPDGINGTSSLGITLTYPDEKEAQDGRYCARCESKSFAGLLACGNIFTGQFSGLVGTTGGKVNYGRPWSTRPKALRFKMKYESGIIDLIGSYPPDDPVKLGDNDRCHIIATVGDWDYRTYGGSKDSPVLVNTTAGIYFTKESAGIIGYGEYITDKSTDWVEVEIPIDYRSLTRKPTHIIVICAASIRGDYLTGSSKTTLWVDDFDLIY